MERGTEEIGRLSRLSKRGFPFLVFAPSIPYKVGHGTVEARIGKKKVSTKSVGAPISLGPLEYLLSRNKNILKGKFVFEPIFLI